MTYAAGHPIRPIAGRLALDFLNTADWSADGEVLHEKIETHADVAAWAKALGLPDALIPEEMTELHIFRSALRAALRDGDRMELSLGTVAVDASEAAVRSLPLSGLVAISAAALLADPREMARLKTCPGVDCGWMFVDETKNGRRRWCSMETCGNRAKAARHYARSRRKPKRDEASA
ncbi:MAG: CGNR zinc finger domain-containing protein [Pseudomonadota bacterium]